ncbi:Lamin Tail Domain [Cnuella takakiae]|uniref:Lamin Tail Domain n=1 Tax=Cnuella takakiae TaxID=1302690 RepID=A0A1M5J8U9_9BACT|nr:lamin tail domain-containing protein [Cnuella takakiae]OLY91750.1 hypothetical protein BUE76_07435 [Cnuella takakiae]SHG36921.1 Lamin Tail Domain [Cnuella takakiae]
MRTYLLAFLLACVPFTFVWAQIPSTVVISQVYGGGGNTGAQYRNDFVELYNPTAAAVSLNGWSLQYAAQAGNFESSTMVNLSGSIAPGGYFLVQLGSAGSVGLPLPAANITASFNIATGSGKLALVNTTTLLPAGCAPTGTGIVDFVGYGSANCYEGTNGTNGLANNTAAHRLENGCRDSNDNDKDFLVYGPSPRNAAAPVHSCATAITIQSVTPLSLCVDANTGATATINYSISGPMPTSLNVFLSDSTGGFATAISIGSINAPSSTGSVSIIIPAGLSSSTRYRVRANGNNAYGVVSNTFEIIYGTKNVSAVNPYPDQTEVSVQWTPPTGCVEEYLVVAKAGAGINGIPAGDGSAYIATASFGGNGTSFDGGKVVYKGPGTSALVTGLGLGTLYYFKVYSRRGTNWSTGLQDTATTRVIPAPGEVLINGFSPRYLNASDEFYELVNTTGKTFNLADLTLQYQSPAGAGRLPLVLGSSLQAHSFWLLAPTTTPVTVGQTVAISRDFTSGSGIQDNGYIALVRRKDNLVVDAVGYGNASGGTFFEGSLLPVLPAPGAYRRKVDGVDGNNNATDFEIIPAGAIDLRNSSSRLANAGAVIPSGAYNRLYVTGSSNIGGNVVLSGKLVFTQGKLALGSFDLSADIIEGARASAYVQTNSAGRLVTTVGTGFLFPVGNATFNPLQVSNGQNRQYRVAIIDSVKATGKEAAVNRTWRVGVSTVPPVAPAFSFYYDEGDPGQLGINFSSADKVQVWNLPAATWLKAGGLQDAVPTGGSVRSVTLNGYNDYGDFVLASATAILPVTFGSVQLQEQGYSRLLSFTTFDEKSLVRYEIEWSADGQNYRTIGTVVPRNNQTGAVHYLYTDQRPLSGSHFYRVKAVEQDGKFVFSAEVSWASNYSLLELNIYPAPLKGRQLHYATQLTAGSYQLQVLDASGRQLWQQPLQHAGGIAAGTVSLPMLPRGTYIFRIAGAQHSAKLFLVE